MLKKNLIVAALAVAGLMVGVSASAQTYVGGTVGTARLSYDCPTTVSCDKNATAYQLFGGYSIDKNFAVEASYFSAGTYKIAGVSSAKAFGADAKADGYAISGVAKFDVTDEFAIFGKLGWARSTTKAEFTSGLTGSDKSSSTDPVIGFGVTYKFSKELALRAEFDSFRDRINSQKHTANALTVGVQYAF